MKIKTGGGGGGGGGGVRVSLNAVRKRILYFFLFSNVFRGRGGKMHPTF